MQTLTNEKEDLKRTMQASRTSNQEDVGRRDTQIAELKTEVESLHERLKEKEKSL